MSTYRSVKLSVIGLGLLAALMLSLTLPQLGQVAHAAKGGQVDYQAQIDSLQAQVNAQLTQINALTTQLNAESAKLADVSADPLTGDLIVTGVNLHVRSGSGATDGAVNGAGNLIIGYNESAAGTGSHNLVVGPWHVYSSYGGIVAGRGNSIEAPYANVTGGQNNYARDWFSSVTGGESNYALGRYSSVNGGRVNTADGDYCSVSGGTFNVASGEYTTVSGGVSRVISGLYSWAAGSLFESY